MTTAPLPTAPRRSAGPTVTLDPIAEKLATVGLDYPASCLPEIVEEATREKLTPLAFLEEDQLPNRSEPQRGIWVFTNCGSLGVLAPLAPRHRRGSFADARCSESSVSSSRAATSLKMRPRDRA